MNDSSVKDTLEVTNFGPIARARIDLRPFTVFVGPSNTGKSYLAMLVYALHRYFSSASADMGFWHPDRVNSPQTIDALAAWVQQELTQEGYPAHKRVVLPNVMTNEVRNIFDLRSNQLNDELCRCFGLDRANTLIRKRARDGACIAFRRYAPNDPARFEHEVVIKAQEPKISITIPEELRININKGSMETLWSMAKNIISSTSSRGKEGRDFPWGLINILNDLVLPELLGPFDHPAFYLPADRTGLMHAHSTVVSALIGSAPMAGLRPAARPPVLSGVLADFLQQLIEFDSPPTWRTRGWRTRARWERPATRRFVINLDKQIEKNILGGSVFVDRSTMVGYPHFLYRPQGWKDALPLIHASSMVSEIAPVVLYLRHMIWRNDTLIIEEPEAHLHPAMQVKFTRQLAALVHAGVRVVITTHSEWVLETLANLVQASKLPEEQRKGIESADPALRPDQVGAWLFKRKMRPRGSVVEEIKMDEESGLFATDYDDVSLELYNDGVTISNRTQNSDIE